MSEGVTREQVQELLNKATPGPWDTDGDSIGADEEWIVHAPKFDRDPRTRRAADLALIAAAPDVFRWALERDQAVRVADELVANLQEQDERNLAEIARLQRVAKQELGDLIRDAW